MSEEISSLQDFDKKNAQFAHIQQLREKGINFYQLIEDLPDIAQTVYIPGTDVDINRGVRAAIKKDQRNGVDTAERVLCDWTLKNGSPYKWQTLDNILYVAKEMRKKGSIGRYNSAGFVPSIAEYIGMSNFLLSRLVKGLRIQFTHSAMCGELTVSAKEAFKDSLGQHKIDFGDVREKYVSPLYDGEDGFKLSSAIAQGRITDAYRSIYSHPANRQSIATLFSYEVEPFSEFVNDHLQLEQKNNLTILDRRMLSARICPKSRIDMKERENFDQLGEDLGRSLGFNPPEQSAKAANGVLYTTSALLYTLQTLLLPMGDIVKLFNRENSLLRTAHGTTGNINTEQLQPKEI